MKLVDPVFPFSGTVAQLAGYVKGVFEKGMELCVEGRVHMPMTMRGTVPSFVFTGTVCELEKYVTDVFLDGLDLNVNVDVRLPAPAPSKVDEDGWLVQLRANWRFDAAVDAGAFAPVWEHIAAGRKIMAIKAVRDVTKLSLTQSKDVVMRIFVPWAEAARVPKQPDEETFSL